MRRAARRMRRQGTTLAREKTMTDKHDEISGLQQDLKTKGLSRRNFLDRVKALGLGFGAAGTKIGRAHV